MTNRDKKDEMSRQTDDQSAKRKLSSDDSTEETPHENLSDNNPPANLAEAIRARFAPLGGIELELPPRGPMRKPPDFE